jgi:hypothetical protein
MLKRRNLSLALTKCLYLVGLLSGYYPSVAKEGMWIPATLKGREKDMKSMGLEIPVDRLYNENGTGLNNAVVLFGRGCTGEIISPEGIVLTNHHCGYGTVQSLSSADKDYFANGYFAKNRNEEIPCPGLTVTFIRRMENVTDKVLAGVSDTLADVKRDSLIARKIAEVAKEYAALTHMDASIKPYFDGNQYWAAITETYTDIRLLGFPPNGIGAFGGDVENWMWPRHTGDFSMFRVYAGTGNKPADYSTSNLPYHTDQFFKINCSGYKEGDFTMVYGFPGTTQEYISSYELKQVHNITDPISIAARTRKLEVWSRHMGTSRDIFLKYTSKRAGVANGWKKWQGEVRGLEVNNVTAKKQAFEKKFQHWASTNSNYPTAKNLLPEIKKEAEAADQLILEDQYNKEAALGVELIQQGAAMENVIKCFRLHLSDQAFRDTMNAAIKGLAGFYKNYDAATDKDVFVSLMILYFNKCAAWLPEYYKEQYRGHNQDISAWANDLYSSSRMASQEKMSAFLPNITVDDSTKLMEDPAWRLYDALNTARKQKILPVLKNYYTRMRYLDRLYMKAQMSMEKGRAFYPNANLTLRLSYGQVKGLDPDGPAKYSFQTTLREAVALDDTTSDIFKVPRKLKELYHNSDFGRWGVAGTMPLAFLASNHTSGGNSGSPVLNARGELIGTNFDRAYEGTMSDYYFDPNRCRNISVDIRYTLFIIDKFGGAGWLIDEMSLVGK